MRALTPKRPTRGREGVLKISMKPPAGTKPTRVRAIAACPRRIAASPQRATIT